MRYLPLVTSFAAGLSNHNVSAGGKSGKTEKYDAIVVGAGAAGCPLAQTLAEGGLKTLLIERGSDPPASGDNIEGSGRVVHSDCVESFFSNGVVVSTGNCMGGSTIHNNGIFIEETPGWFEENFGDDFFDEDMIEDAFTWVREQVAEPTRQITTEGQEFFEEVIKSMESQGFEEADTDGATVAEYGTFRPYSIFDQDTGERFSADKLLDTENENLVIMKNSEVKKLTFKQKKNKSYAVSCVQFMDETKGDACIKKNGRIYLTAGAFHTPELLMKSGIGEGGSVYNNSQVGKNLQDKPIATAATFFKSDLEYDELEWGGLAGNKLYDTITGESRNLLLQEGSVGLGDQIFELLLFERNFLPPGLRDSEFAGGYILSSRCCQLLGGGVPPGSLPAECSLVPDLMTVCLQFNEFLSTGCLTSISINVLHVANPSSTGSVEIGPDGKLAVDVNYLSDPGDIDAFGEAARLAFKIKSGIDPLTPYAPQDPDEHGDICPIAYQDFADSTLAAAGINNPFAGYYSTVQPNVIHATLDALDNCCSYLNYLLSQGYSYDEAVSQLPSDCLPLFVLGDQNPCEAPNFVLGLTMKETSILAAHHIAGTARIGDVIDSNLEVIGVKGLYVADGAALKTTPRVNSMATIMMLGRLAGQAFVEETVKGKSGKSPKSGKVPKASKNEKNALRQQSMDMNVDE